MKKFLLALMVVAISVVLAGPAMADLKLTTKGRMDVTGMLVYKNIIDRAANAGNDSTNAWYQQELVIDPTLHINDKVRIHSRITIMERNWTGGSGDGDNFPTFAGNGVVNPLIGTITYTNYPTSNAQWDTNYRGQHNWWVERLYMSFPLMGGHLYTGRMSGGAWAYTFQDSDANRDRIKYVRKFGKVLGVGLVEKLGEDDGGLLATNGTLLTQAPAAGDTFDKSYSDTNAYAFGLVIPFSKNIVWKPLIYYIQFQGLNGYDALLLNGFGIKFAQSFSFDIEFNWRWGTWDNFFAGAASPDLERSQLSAWAEVAWRGGPFEAGLGGFWIQGEGDANTTGTNKRQAIWGLGGEFQPYLLFLSEDCGLLWNTTGVANGSAQANGSGYQSIYLRGSYKLSDSMKLSGIFGMMMADKMLAGTHWNGGTASDDLGTEIDLTFQWKLMDNLTYVVDGGYLFAGNYFDDAFGAANFDPSNDVFGFRHMLVIEW